MIRRKVLHEILQDPLGPYHEKDVLDKDCQSSGRCQLVLYSFILEHNGRVIGYAPDAFLPVLKASHPLYSLDESETPLDGPGEDKRKFRFRGILNIGDPEWLSEFGVKIVEAELNLRLKEWCMREGERPKTPLSLKSLFNGKLLRRRNSSFRNDDGECELLLKIQGERGMPAVFMHCTCFCSLRRSRPNGLFTARKAPEGLLWTSKDQYVSKLARSQADTYWWPRNRKYEVLTMDVASYSRSENYFWRYRLLDIMDKICKKRGDIDSIKKQDPEWFTRQYLRFFAYPKEDRHRRLIHDSDDSDLDDEGNPRTPRQLLHVHKSEILGLFAAHSEWIINQEISRPGIKLNVEAWEAFSQRVKKERRDAAKNGVSWGWPVGQEHRADDFPSSASSEEEGSDENAANLVIGKSKEVVKRKRKIAKRKKLKGRVESSASESESDPEGHAYASDWSVPSDSAWESDELNVDDQDVRDAIPWELRMLPDPPDADGRWRCPLPNCLYEVDLRNLTEDECWNADRAVAGYILQKRWRNVYQDGTVLEGWLQMVRNHYDDHFTEVGVRWADHTRVRQTLWLISAVGLTQASVEPR